MTSPSVDTLERDVQSARLRLVDNISALASPDSRADAIDAAKEDVRLVKRDVQARIWGGTNSYIEELKARAASNPTAVLAITAGVAWKLFQKPPITTALVGAGLYSLLKTEPDEVIGGDYTGHAKERFRAQVGAARDTVVEKAAEAGEVLREKAGELAEDVTTKVGDLSRQARASLGEMSESAGERAASLMHDARDAAREGSARGMETARKALDSSTRLVSEQRDQALLGIAGLAVAAAIGVVLQRRRDE